MPLKTHVRVAAYIPVTDSPYTGIPERRPRARVDFIIDKILRPLDQHITDTHNDPDTVIRLFAAPEWTFRQPAPTGASANDQYQGIPYTESEKNVVISRLRSASKTLKNWLIVPGSICWGVSDRTQFKWYNSIPVIMNGRLLHLYHKQHDADNFSGLNGKYNGKQVVKPAIISHRLAGGQLEAEDSGHTALHAGNWHQFRDIVPAPEAVSPFFSVDGRRFAVEICADFTSGTSLRYYMRDYPDETGTAMHIVLASGVLPGPTNYQLSTVRPGGHLVLVNSASTAKNATEVQTVTQRTGSVKSSALAVANDATQIQGQRHQPDTTQDVMFVGGNNNNNAYRAVVYPNLFALPAGVLNEVPALLDGLVHA